jgi:hypothetical protein
MIKYNEEKIKRECDNPIKIKMKKNQNLISSK